MNEQSRDSNSQTQAPTGVKISTPGLQKLTGLRALFDELGLVRGDRALLCGTRSEFEGAFLHHLGLQTEVCVSRREDAQRESAHAPIRVWSPEAADFRLHPKSYRLIVLDRVAEASAESAFSLNETTAFEFARGLTPGSTLAVFVPASSANETATVLRTAGFLLSQKGQTSLESIAPMDVSERLLVFQGQLG